VGALRINGRRLETERAAGADQRGEGDNRHDGGEEQRLARNNKSLERIEATKETEPSNEGHGYEKMRPMSRKTRIILGVRSRNLWNGHWWLHVRFCSTHCEALHDWSDTTPTQNMAATLSLEVV
jgi:hypothetical protein